MIINMPNKDSMSVQEVTDYIKNEANRTKAVVLAKQLIDVMGRRKWFKVRDVQNRFTINGIEATQKLELLKVFGFARVKTSRGGEKEYSVELDKTSELLFIKDEIAIYTKRIEFLSKRQKELEETQTEEDVKH